MFVPYLAPLEPVSVLLVIWAAILCALFSLSTIGLGCLVYKFRAQGDLSGNFGVALASGSAVLAISYFGVGLIFGFGMLGQTLLLIIETIGVVWFCRLFRLYKGPLIFSWPVTLSASIVALTVLLRVLQGFRYHSHGDPLYYHLVRSRFWLAQGRVVFPWDDPIQALAGTWEMFVGAGILWIGSGSDGGLALGQNVGQWLHAGVGFGGSALLLYSLSSRLFENHWIRAGAVVFSLCSPALVDMSHLAKNDWGVTLWALASLLILVRLAELEDNKRSSSRLLGLSGFLAGIAGSAKSPSLITVIPMFSIYLFWMLYRRESLASLCKCVLLLSIGFLTGFGPYALWLWYYTGNPVFPSLSHLFSPTVLGPSATANLSTLARTTQDSWLKLLELRIQEFTSQTPLHDLLFLSPIGVVYFALRREGLKAALFFVTTFGAILFALVSGQNLMIRIAGPLLVLQSLGVATLLAYLIVMIPIQRIWAPACFSVLVFFVHTSLPLYTFIQLAPSRFQTWPNAFSGHAYYELKTWILSNIQSGKSLFFETEGMNYYLSGYRFLHYPRTPSLDRAFSESTSSDDVFRALRSADADYAVLIDPGEQSVRHFGLHLKNYADTHPEQVVYRNPTDPKQIVLKIK